MGFDPCNRSLKIRGSIGTPTPKVDIKHTKRVESQIINLIPPPLKVKNRPDFLKCRSHVTYH